MRGSVRCHPIWSCSVRGFACHRRYRRRGALLPHLFTLTPRLGTASRPCLARGGIFSVPLIRQVALPGRYPAHCPVEFGLSSPRRESSGGRLADCDLVIIAYGWCLVVGALAARGQHI